MSHLTLEIITALSGLISVLCFIVNTIYLNEVVKRHTQYGNANLLLFFVILGVWLSLFKFLLTSLIFHRLNTAWKAWIKAHVFFFVMLVIIFTVGMVEKSELNGGTQGNLFTGLTAIDFVVSLCGSIVFFCIGRRLDDI